MSANVHLKSRMSELCIFEVTRGKGWYETPNILLIFGDRGTPECGTNRFLKLRKPGENPLLSLSMRSNSRRVAVTTSSS